MQPLQCTMATKLWFPSTTWAFPRPSPSNTVSVAAVLMIQSAGFDSLSFCSGVGTVSILAPSHPFCRMPTPLLHDPLCVEDVVQWQSANCSSVLLLLLAAVQEQHALKHESAAPQMVMYPRSKKERPNATQTTSTNTSNDCEVRAANVHHPSSAPLSALALPKRMAEITTMVDVIKEEMAKMDCRVMEATN